jgi:hypothetical protein
MKNNIPEEEDGTSVALYFGRVAEDLASADLIGG